MKQRSMAMLFGLGLSCLLLAGCNTGPAWSQFRPVTSQEIEAARPELDLLKIRLAGWYDHIPTYMLLNLAADEELFSKLLTDDEYAWDVIGAALYFGTDGALSRTGKDILNRDSGGYDPLWEKLGPQQVSGRTGS